jgi:hypothetical protein
MFYTFVFEVTLPQGETYEDEVEVEANSFDAARAVAESCFPGATLTLLSHRASRMPQTKYNRLRQQERPHKKVKKGLWTVVLGG